MRRQIGVIFCRVRCDWAPNTPPKSELKSRQADHFSNETLSGTPSEHRVETHINFGADPNADLGYSPPVYPANAGSARWAGFYKAPNVGAHDFFVQSADEGSGYYRVFVDDKLILDNWTEVRALVGLDTLDLSAGVHKVVVEHHGRGGFLGSRFRFGIVPHGTYVNPIAEKLASMADAVIVAVGFSPDSESEGSDRTFRLPPGQDELIEKMAALNKRTIVVVTSGGSVDDLAERPLSRKSASFLPWRRFVPWLGKRGNPNSARRGIRAAPSAILGTRYAGNGWKRSGKPEAPPVYEYHFEEVPATKPGAMMGKYPGQRNRLETRSGARICI